MWRLYLELTVLVLVAFALGAGIAYLVVRALVPATPPGDELGDAGAARLSPGSPA